MIRIQRGLDIPLAGAPRQAIESAQVVKTVALVAADYHGLKPSMEVAEGDRVKVGQPLFTDKSRPGVKHTSPAAGTVQAVNRGHKRAFQSLVIEVDGDDRIEFPSYGDADLTALSRDQVKDSLLESGLWTAFRQRPYSRVPAVDAQPHSIFVSAIDTNPLAADPAVVLAESGRDFVFGLQVIKHLTDGKLFLCKKPGTVIPGDDLDGITSEEFDGPHPAGLPGTHIHKLDPVGRSKSVWYINYQDVVAIGVLFTTGQLSVERVVSLAGPTIHKPRLLRTRLGASLSELTAGEYADESPQRVLSGSALAGRAAVEPTGFLGRYHCQVTVLPEGGQRSLLGWLAPGFKQYSIKPVFASAWAGASDTVTMTTATNGSPRAMVPVGSYESVMPFDMVPTFLLRSLIIEDTEQAEALGCLELDEEDLALCTFVCPGKYTYGPMLRAQLQLIEKEG